MLSRVFYHCSTATDQNIVFLIFFKLGGCGLPPTLDTELEKLDLIFQRNLSSDDVTGRTRDVTDKGLDAVQLLDSSP